MDSNSNNTNFTTKLVDLVNQKYPNWEGFSDSRFLDDEVRYKQAAIAKARDLLSKSELDRLINKEKNFDEVISRIEKVGRSTNLLFQGVPMAGDLNIIYQPNLDRRAFCTAFYNLLYGTDTSPERLATYSAFVQSSQLPNKWTFPTFFLCICHPDTEMFVKPRTTQWFLQFCGYPNPLPSSPSAEIYSSILNLCKELWDELHNFQPHDWIDIQGLIWVGYQQRLGIVKLGKPFNNLFSDFQEAEWAFDWLQESMEVLGVNNENDLMIAINIHKDGNQNLLRFIYGNWLILGFSGGSGKLNSIDITLPTGKMDLATLRKGDFKVKPDETPFSLYKISIEDFRLSEAKIREAYFSGLSVIRERFKTWTKSNFHDHQKKQVASAVFDVNLRPTTFTQPLPVSQGGSDTDLEALYAPESYFTELTFQWLQNIHQNPRKEFYEEHSFEFKNYIEEPFKILMEKVGLQLSPFILERMETRRKTFAKFLKNDYGQGGAWDFFWGAFYPKGGRRTADAQLALLINKDSLEISFYIGDYGLNVQERFQRNTRLYREPLKTLLFELITDPKVSLDRGETHGADQKPLIDQSPSWDEWLINPQVNKYSVKVILDKSEVISMSRINLENLIIRYFNLFFPLILVSQEEDPIPMIELFLGANDSGDGTFLNPVYTIDDVSTKIGFSADEIRHWVNAIHRKGQAIIYGPPGTGKTFIAKELAKHLLSDEQGFMDIVQFHPAYSYEEFMQGIRPKARPEGGLDYPTVSGRFLEFCRTASQTNGTCVLIIDEINRANLARVFGELMYLLEYRDEAIPLAGGGLFRIPNNVRVIGTMNTADRSIALVDHALRRRFAFLPIFPNYDVLRKFHHNNNTGFPVEDLVTILENLNSNYIRNQHYEIGISYFMSKSLAAEIEDIWRMEIQPYLDEYFFDQPASALAFRWEKIRDKFTGLVS